MGDYHVRFCERLGVKFPLSTRHKHVAHNNFTKRRSFERRRDCSKITLEKMESENNKITLLNISTGVLSKRISPISIHNQNWRKISYNNLWLP